MGAPQRGTLWLGFCPHEIWMPSASLEPAGRVAPAPAIAGMAASLASAGVCQWTRTPRTCMPAVCKVSGTCLDRGCSSVIAALVREDGDAVYW